MRRRFEHLSSHDLSNTRTTSGVMDGPASNAQFDLPQAVALDRSGNVYVGDQGGRGIRKVSKTGDVTTVKEDWRSRTPTGIAVHEDGTICVADTAAHRVRFVGYGGLLLKVLVGSGTPTEGSAEGKGEAVAFNSPSGMALGPDNALYVSDMGNHRICKITLIGEVAIVAGSGLAEGTGIDDGIGTTARFRKPTGVAVDKQGRIYVADAWNHRIRRIE